MEVVAIFGFLLLVGLAWSLLAISNYTPKLEEDEQRRYSEYWDKIAECQLLMAREVLLTVLTERSTGGKRSAGTLKEKLDPGTDDQATIIQYCQ
ncbi:MAG TPA: hypothetical protein VIT23_05605 [Terrimicrobiaceae bacterium]